MSQAIETAGPAGSTVGARALHFGLEMVANIGLPFVVYSYAEASLGPVHALMASSAPPVLWALVEFARRRRIDALSLLVLTGIGLSLLVVAAGGSIRFLQLREKLVTALFGLAFLGSAAIGHPLIYQLGRAFVGRRNPSELGQFEALKHNAGFKRAMTVMTVVWGTALVAEAALAAALVFVLSVGQYLLVGPLLGYAVFGCVGLWSFFYVRSYRRARLAAQADAR